MLMDETPNLTIVWHTAPIYCCAREGSSSHIKLHRGLLKKARQSSDTCERRFVNRIFPESGIEPHKDFKSLDRPSLHWQVLDTQPGMWSKTVDSSTMR